MPSSVKHKPIYNTKPNHNNNNNQKIAIASLNSTKQQIRQMQNQIANETSDLMGKLDSQAKFNMKMLQKLTQKINLTIKKILCFSSADLDTIPEKIRNILSIMSEKELRKQTNSWKISKFKIGASGIEETFSNLVTFTIDPKLLELISKDKNKLLDSSDAPQEYDGLNVSA